MEITDVKIFLVGEEKLKAFVSIVLDGCFMINDIKVIEGRDGLFISMPSRKKRNGQFKDVAHPLNQETRTWMEDAILGEYQRALEEKEGARERAPQSAVGANGASEQPASQQRVAAAPAEGDEDGSEASLEEVHKRHLSDAFWSVS
jgi:stage V sporulation protein G